MSDTIWTYVRGGRDAEDNSPSQSDTVKEAEARSRRVDYKNEQSINKALRASLLLGGLNSTPLSLSTSSTQSLALQPLSIEGLAALYEEENLPSAEGEGDENVNAGPPVNYALDELLSLDDEREATCFSPIGHLFNSVPSFSLFKKSSATELHAEKT